MFKGQGVLGARALDGFRTLGLFRVGLSELFAEFVDKWSCREMMVCRLGCSCCVLRNLRTFAAIQIGGGFW